MTRFVAALLLALSLLSGVASAQPHGTPQGGGTLLAQATPKPGDVCDKARESCWNRANVAPYGNGGVERAIDLLIDQTLISDAARRTQVKQALLAKVRTGPDWSEPIPRNFRSTRMVFAGGVILPNAVAGTDHWLPGQTRMADFYQFVAPDGTVYLLFRPHVCSNWAIRIITPQGICIYDEILCAIGCQKLRRQLE